MQKDLKGAYQNMHQLTRSERTLISKDLLTSRPDFLKEFTPKWWWFSPCEVKVLLVADGLDFEFNGGGLSEFITTFNKLEQSSLLNVKYKVTVAQRTGAMPSNPNPVITNRLNNFRFDTSVTLNDFDQVWLFGIDTSYSLSAAEIAKIETYMNGGGGLFATGDHGSLGNSLCGQIPRVKDMRYWSDFGANEVGMNESRRNDTNRPGAGQTVSNQFNNQSDDIPQNIAVRTFGAGMPHPLLSINTSKRSSGIIDIMPDHPHEGECKPETVFAVTNPVTNVIQNIPTQIIATSFVLGGSTSGGKDATQPHCFPSISVFDGRIANVGRIVIDSTWHHFVNINLNGVGGGVGLTDNDFEVVQQYYMNIATWMTRKKSMLCWRKWIWINLLKNSQLIEASLNNPKQKASEIKTTDLYAIGSLAKEIIASDFTPVFAEEFAISLIEQVSPSFCAHLNVWSPQKNEIANNLINHDYILGVAIGAGFIALRDRYSNEIDNNKFDESSFNKVSTIFDDGAKYGLEIAFKSIVRNFEHLSKNMFGIKK